MAMQVTGFKTKVRQKIDLKAFNCEKHGVALRICVSSDDGTSFSLVIGEEDMILLSVMAAENIRAAKAGEKPQLFNIIKAYAKDFGFGSIFSDEEIKKAAKKADESEEADVGIGFTSDGKMETF